MACTPPKEAEIRKSTFSTRRVCHKAQPSAEDSGRCSGAAARWLVTPKRPGATCGAGEEYQEKYGPHGLSLLPSILAVHRKHQLHQQLAASKEASAASAAGCKQLAVHRKHISCISSWLQAGNLPHNSVLLVE